MPALSLGLFAAPAGHVDTQEPHEQDEVYVVLAGSAVLDVDGQRTAVTAGSVAYVPARVPHRFVDVTGDLRVVVVFAAGRLSYQPRRSTGQSRPGSAPAGSARRAGQTSAACRTPQGRPRESGTAPAGRAVPPSGEHEKTRTSR